MSLTFFFFCVLSFINDFFFFHLLLHSPPHCPSTHTFTARSTINNNNLVTNNKKDIKESTDSNNATIEDEEIKFDRICKYTHTYMFIYLLFPLPYKLFVYFWLLVHFFFYMIASLLHLLGSKNSYKYLYKWKRNRRRRKIMIERNGRDR